MKRKIACTGHIDLSRIPGFDETITRRKLRAFFEEQGECVLFCGLASGADLIFAEEALGCGAELVAVLPCEKEEFALEHRDDGAQFWRLAEYIKEIVIASHPIHRYLGVGEYMAEQCDVMLGMCDVQTWSKVEKTGEEVPPGGTFDCLRMAKKAGKEIVLV